MIEISARVHHCRRSHRLANTKQYEAGDQPRVTHAISRLIIRGVDPRENFCVGKVLLMQITFEESEEVRDVVRAPVVEEEGGCGCNFGVVERCGVVFQTMEQRKGAQEEWEAP